MNQIYNLLETIEQDKEAVALLKKRLHHAESILKAHTAALERLTTIPNASVKDVVKTSKNGVQEEQEGQLERITLENWSQLGIKAGDKVKIASCQDTDFEEGGVYEVWQVEEPLYKRECPFCLLTKTGRELWLMFKDNIVDELYLIRTQDGSL